MSTAVDSGGVPSAGSTFATLIRVDASVAVGTGHVMRCLTLAQKLKSIGSRVVFFCRPLQGNLLAFIEAAGFAAVALPMSSTWEEDAASTNGALRRLGEARPGLLVVDHYGLDARWESTLKEHFQKVLVIDDLADRPHDCDGLLDQNFYGDANLRYRGLVPERCELFLGPTFTLLRSEFYELRATVAARALPIRRILVFFGGSDPSNVTARVLAALEPRPGVALDVVVGSSNPYGDAIEAMSAARGDATFHRQTPHLARLMAAADLSIGAGGTATWERCMLGLPTITVTVATNQVETTKAVHEYGAAFLLGAAEDVTAAEIRGSVDQFLRDATALARMSAKALELMAPATGGSPLLASLRAMLTSAPSLKQ